MSNRVPDSIILSRPVSLVDGAVSPRSDDLPFDLFFLPGPRRRRTTSYEHPSSLRLEQWKHLGLAPSHLVDQQGTAQSKDRTHLSFLARQV